MRISRMGDSQTTASSRTAAAEAGSPRRQRLNPSPARARAYHGDAGSFSSSTASWAHLSITPRPSKPNTPRSIAADDCSEAIPSGSGPG